MTQPIDLAANCVWCGRPEEEHGPPGVSPHGLGTSTDRLCPVNGVTSQFFTPPHKKPRLDLAVLRAANAERRRLKEAAEGGWWEVSPSCAGPDWGWDIADGEYRDARFGCKGTARFISAARNDPVEDEVDALLDEVERLRTLIPTAADLGAAGLRNVRLGGKP